MRGHSYDLDLALLLVFLISFTITPKDCAITTLADLESQVVNIIDDYYERQSILPLQNVSETMEVKLQFHLNHLTAADGGNGHVTISGYLSIAWVEERHKPISDDVWSLLPAPTIWTPPLTVVNSVSSSQRISTDNEMVNYHLKTNTVAWKPYIMPAVVCERDRFFPFDSMDCKISILSKEYEFLTMALLVDTDVIDMSNYVENTEWELKSTSVKVTVVDSKHAMDVLISLKRRSTFYTVAMISSPVLVGVLHAFVFLIPNRPHAPRLTFSCVLFIASLMTFLLVQWTIHVSNAFLAIVTYYNLFELIVNASINAVGIVLVKWEHGKQKRRGLAPSGNKVGPRQLQANAESESTERSDNLALKETMVAWDTAESDDDSKLNGFDSHGTNSELTKHTSTRGNHNGPKNNESKADSIDIVLFVVILFLHVMVSIGFFAPITLLK